MNMNNQSFIQHERGYIQRRRRRIKVKQNCNQFQTQSIVFQRSVNIFEMRNQLFDYIHQE
ncbi:unnamed protein product [Paramecium primaurelia]|uniref:Uncharacterized protein n=1 Tax=Paramecium primaurelia TaxID=5886 RepID=A0A8S1Q3L6_PARPR|nr:unnamed protein product [Paramecium primaurelia]